jgi:hypothetical protein
MSPRDPTWERSDAPPDVVGVVDVVELDAGDEAGT